MSEQAKSLESSLDLAHKFLPQVKRPRTTCGHCHHFSIPSQGFENTLLKPFSSLVPGGEDFFGFCKTSHIYLFLPLPQFDRSRGLVLRIRGLLGFSRCRTRWNKFCWIQPNDLERPDPVDLEDCVALAQCKVPHGFWHKDEISGVHRSNL